MKLKFVGRARLFLYPLKNEFLFSFFRNNYCDASFKFKLHVYNRKSLFPWSNIENFTEHLAASIVYKKDGLIALNKPFGIKIHSHDKPGTRSKEGQRFIMSSIQDCDFSIEDTLESLKSLLRVPSLTILKSTERYTSGIVLLSANEKTSNAVKKSFNIVKLKKLPVFTHWILTLGYPVVPYRKEKVGIKFVETGNLKQPIIVTDISKRSCKLKRVTPYEVEYRTLSTNQNLPSSLVEVSCSSVKYHFVRVYASSRINSIMGDILYSNRMNTLLGVPVNVHVQQALAYDLPPLSPDLASALEVHKGVRGHSSIPTMLHLKSVFLPSFKGEDLTIAAPPPTHFKWTANKLNLLSSE